MKGQGESSLIDSRPVLATDEPFLLEAYCSTRHEELVGLGWTTAQMEAFCRMQFSAQSRAYGWQYPDADHRILLHDGFPAGRILVHRSAQEIRLVDITLLPAYRNRGLGTELLRSLQQEAASADKPLRLSVLSQSPARRLYERLGLAALDENGIYCAMEWTPPEH